MTTTLFVIFSILLIIIGLIIFFRANKNWKLPNEQLNHDEKLAEVKNTKEQSKNIENSNTFHNNTKTQDNERQRGGRNNNYK